MAAVLLDAAGRAIVHGDTVGGTVVQPYMRTVVGTVIDLAEGTVNIDAGTDGEFRLTADRVFRIGRQLTGDLYDCGPQLLGAGPALFYFSETAQYLPLLVSKPVDPATRTVHRVDQRAPEGDRDRSMCRALVLYALDIHKKAMVGTPLPAPVRAAEGPALVYASSDRTTLTRIDEEPVLDDRENALCSALLFHALVLTENLAPAQETS